MPNLTIMNYKTGDVLIGTPAASDEYRVTTEGSVILFLEASDQIAGFAGRERFRGWHVGYLGDPTISQKIRDAQNLLKNIPLQELHIWTVSIHNLRLCSARRKFLTVTTNSSPIHIFSLLDKYLELKDMLNQQGQDWLQH